MITRRDLFKLIAVAPFASSLARAPQTVVAKEFPAFLVSGYVTNGECDEYLRGIYRHKEVAFTINYKED